MLNEIVEEDFEEFKVGEVSPYCSHIIFLGTNGVKGSYKRFYIKCLDCAKDEELYGDAVFKVSIRPLRSGKSCYCYNKLKPDSRIYLVKIKRKCEEIGYKYRGFKGDKLLSSSKLKLTCDKGHEYETTSVSKFLSSDRRCPICAGNYPRDYTPDKVLELLRKARGYKYEYTDLENVKNNRTKFTAVCKLHGEFKTDLYHHAVRKQDCPHPDCRFKKISEVKASTTEEFVSKAKNVHGDKYDYTYTTYDRAFKDVDIFCKSCGNTFTQKPSDHLAGCGCNLCGNHQKQLYLFVVYDNELPVAVKVGKAVDYKNRLRRQTQKSCFDIKPKMLWKTDHHYITKQAEAEVKSTFNGSFLSEREYPDGYTETFSTEDMEQIISMLDKYGLKSYIKSEDCK